MSTNNCDCLMLSNRLITLKYLRTKVFHQVHTSHPGLIHMKAVSLSYSYWPVSISIATIYCLMTFESAFGHMCTNSYLCMISFFGEGITEMTEQTLNTWYIPCCLVICYCCFNLTLWRTIDFKPYYIWIGLYLTNHVFSLSF